MKKHTVAAKALSIILSGAMVLSLAGCGSKSTKSSNEIDLKEVSYAMEEIGGITGWVCAISPLSDKVYVASQESEDMTEYPEGWENGMPTDEAADTEEDIEYNYVNTVHLYTLTPEGKDLKEIASEQLEDIWSLDNMSALPDGSVCCLYSGYNDVTENSESMLQMFTPDGKKGDSFSMMDFFDDPSDAYVQDMIVDKDGNLYFQMDNLLLCIDREGKEQFRITVNGYINSMARDKEGKIVCCVYEDDGMSVKVVDPASKGFQKTNAGEGVGSIRNLLGGFGSYDYLIWQSQGIDGADYNGGRKTILSWIGSNLESEYINKVTTLGDGNFLAYYNDYTQDEEDGQMLVRLRKMDPSEVENRQVVTYGGMYIDEEIKKTAIAFNRSQSQYQVVFRDYSDNDDPETKMNADLLAGDVPDIIDMAWLPEEKYIGKGLLMDLYPLMEKDPDIKKEDFFENVLQTLESDGKLYRIAPTYQLTLLAGSADDLKGKKNLTIPDIMEMEKHYEGSKAFSTDNSKENILSSLCMNVFDTFVDWDTGKCSYDSDEFVQILEYANTYKNAEDITYDEDSDFVTNIRGKKQLFTDLWSLSYEDVEIYDALYDHKVGFVGYPSSQEGYGARFTSVIGIYDKTPNQEGAWAFLKELLSRKYLSSSEYDHGMPLRKDCFEDDMKRVTTTTKYTDDFGIEREPLNYTMGMSGDLEIQVKPLTKDQEKLIRELVSGVNHRFSSDKDIETIIEEEAGALFSGQKSAKEVAGIIQNRVSTYVNETR